MKTVITLEVEHTKPLPLLGEMICQRAYPLDGVVNTRVVDNDQSLAAFHRAVQGVLNVFKPE